MNGPTNAAKQTFAPSVIAGWLIMVFSLLVILEGFFPVNKVTLFLGVVLAAAGWFLRYTGIKAAKLTEGETWWARLHTRWLVFLPVCVPVVALVYVAGYFALMDRRAPTDRNRAQDKNFESSFRWAGNEVVRHPAMPASRTNPWPAVTIWNVIYERADKFYFHLFPRSAEELEKLANRGDLR